MRSPSKPRKKKNGPFKGLPQVCKKEFIHISRDLPTIIFILIVAAMELMLYGFAVNTNIRQIKTIIYDMAQTQESNELIRHFANSDDFKIITIANSDKEINDAIVSGKARVGIKIPVDYSRRAMENNTARVLVLVDGSDPTVTAEAISASNELMLGESIKQLVSKVKAPVPFEVRHTVLFNPDTRTPNFILPGAIVLSLQLSLVFLIAVAIVRERERGTLEQLYMTPVRPLAVMIGKMIPYAIFGFFQHSEMVFLMCNIFNVPIHGNYFTLVLLTGPYLMVMLGLGLMISVKANTQLDAMMMSTSMFLPSILLSGFIFEIDSMPQIFQFLSKLIPAAYFVDIMRGVIVRGADLSQLWPGAAIMLAMGTTLIFMAAKQFQKIRP
jgi:ABC-2 type transport system permease protein